MPRSQKKMRAENLTKRLLLKWELGFCNKNGANEYGVITEHTHELVIGCINKDLADHLIEAHNIWLDKNFGEALA